MKRIDMRGDSDDMLSHIKNPGIQLLPNTSGVRSAEEALFAAQLSREAFETNFLKLEIHPDPKYLLPDPIETLKATEMLAKEGFIVLPYIQADPVLCKRLEDAGASAVPAIFFLIICKHHLPFTLCEHFMMNAPIEMIHSY